MRKTVCAVISRELYSAMEREARASGRSHSDIIRAALHRELGLLPPSSPLEDALRRAAGEIHDTD